ncbi:serpin family protein [Pseudonocardia sp. TRM90224]|uniref:serpin family protein n=1 Tax=Pseudonocardia sp. TRM90224 TaxID=2812678 RepID=UPI001E4A78C0|nr:serpin family protein [Pseudonocardia sp. TRM90224]
MNRRAFLTSALAAALTAGCGFSTVRPPDARRAAGVDRSAVDPVVPTAPVVDGLVAFGSDLGRALADPMTNLVFSPASIGFAFGMVRAGARGATADQIDAAFRFPPTGPHAPLNTIAQAVVTPNGLAGRPGRPAVSVANGLFAQHGLPIAEAFLRTLAGDYGAGVADVDFSSPAAAEQINAWVRAQTAERIDKLFDKIAPDTLLVLANAIYLKADWQVPFDGESTTDATFTRADRSTVLVPTMRKFGESMSYASAPGWQAVELPYAGDELVMWVLVPTGHTPAVDLLAPPTLAAVRTGLVPTPVALTLPRWDFATDVKLVEQMRKLGVEVPFSSAADFSGITDGVFISAAMHRANITVNETGTEAAAVTGIGAAGSGPPEPQAEVRADHPFAFSIVHKPTGTPLFNGVVADPAAR